MKEETEVKILDYESPQTSFSALFSGKPKKFHVGWYQPTCAIYDIHVKDRYWPMDKHRSCSGAVTNGYLHCRFISCGFLINRFVVWCVKCKRMVEKRRSKPEMTSANVSFHPQPKFFAVYRHRGGKKPENLHICEAGIRELCLFFHSNRFIGYQNSWQLIKKLTANQSTKQHLYFGNYSPLTHCDQFSLELLLKTSSWWNLRFVVHPV